MMAGAAAATTGPWFDVPAGTEPAQCRSCKAVVYWTTTPGGKRMPIDCEVDGGFEPSEPRAANGYDGRGVSHFATCPHADDWRNR